MASVCHLQFVGCGLFSNVYSGHVQRRQHQGRLRLMDLETILKIYSMFKPVRIPSVGTFEDGALKHNNPINIAIWESKIIWPTLRRPSIVVSLGTGHYEPTLSPDIVTPKSTIQDKFLFRIWRSWMSSIDGEAVHRDLMNSMDPDECKDYHRLTVPLPWPELAPNDYGALVRLSQALAEYSAGYLQRYHALVQTQIASFYMEMNELPSFDNGEFQCHATIRCLSSGIVTSLLDNSADTFEFYRGSSNIGRLSAHDICRSCGRFCKQINFVAKSLDEDILISLKGTKSSRPIGAMPKQVSWFIQMQELYSPFGSRHSAGRGFFGCCRCSQRSLNFNKGATKRSASDLGARRSKRSRK